MSRFWVNCALALLVGASTCSCASKDQQIANQASLQPVTVYEPMNFWSNGGYRDKDLSPNSVEVFVAAMSVTSRERIEQIGAVRAGELCIQKKFKSFTVKSGNFKTTCVYPRLNGQPIPDGTSTIIQYELVASFSPDGNGRSCEAEFAKLKASLNTTPSSLDKEAGLRGWRAFCNERLPKG